MDSDIFRKGNCNAKRSALFDEIDAPFPQHDTYPPEALDKASTSGSNLTRQTKYRPQAENDRDARSQDGRLQKETTGVLHGHFAS
jgi:hypothetical protein